jgi:Dolichyl-phosphate-mannose-protein mannosyltransferase
MNILKQRISHPLLVILVLVVCFVVRIQDINWDDNHHVHPDERFITTTALETFPPQSLGDLFNPRRSALNPYWNVSSQERRHFAYGAFPLYLVRLSATLVGSLASNDFFTSHAILVDWSLANDYDHLNLVGRALSAVFDTLTIGIIYLLGRRLYNHQVGLLAAALSTLTVQQIQLAHFFAFDTIAATLIFASLYFALRVVQNGKLADSVLLGAVVALAVGSKFSALPLVFVILVAHLLRLLCTINRVNTELSLSPNPLMNGSARLNPAFIREFQRALLRILLCLLYTLLVYVIVSPFTILDFNGFWSSISSESEMVRGILDYPYTRQYRNTGLEYWLENFVFWATGPALGFAALSGLAFAFLRMTRRRLLIGELVLLAWIIPYGAITLTFQVKFLRYLLPLTPLLTLMGAYVLWQFAHVRLRLPGRFPLSLIRVLPMVVVVVGTLLYAIAFMHIYTQPLTRISASEWIYRNIQPGSTLTWEDWDDPLPFAAVIDGRQRRAEEYHMLKMALQEPDDALKLANIRQWLDAADYVVLSSNRMYGWLPRLANRFPLTNRYYDLLFAGKLGFQPVAEFAVRPQLGSLVLIDDHADESFTVYDHPKVTIFRKVRSLSGAEFNALFTGVPSAQNPAPPISIAVHDETLVLDQPAKQLLSVNDKARN